MERFADLDRPVPSAAPGPMRGLISELKHLSAGTDVSSTHLVSTLNSGRGRVLRRLRGDERSIRSVEAGYDGGIHVGPRFVFKNVAH